MLELTGLGWNALTFSFAAIVSFTLFGAWALWHQYRNICREQSGETVSVIWMTVFAAAIAGNYFYGLERLSLAMILHGVCRLPFILLVLMALGRFRGFARHECFLMGIVIIGLSCMAMSSARVHFFEFFSYAGAVGAAHQPWKLWQKKDVGVLSLGLIIVSLISSLVWTLYGLAIKDMSVALISATYLMIFYLTAGLWWYYRKI